MNHDVDKPGGSGMEQTNFPKGSETPHPKLPGELPGAEVPGVGRIDIHSHLLPGVDDGCENVEESIACIKKLQAIGYTATICTPHIIPDTFPNNTVANIARWVEQLRDELARRDIDYTIWTGGEINLSKTITDWLSEHGVPTLADSRCVLMDYWDETWPAWIDGVFQWFLDQGYQPILAHPERMRCVWNQPEKLDHLREMGVWLQGNFLPITGEDGYEADQLIHRLIEEQRYQLLGLDMHRLDSLDSRVDGMQMMLNQFGQRFLDYFTVDAPRQLIFPET